MNEAQVNQIESRPDVCGGKPCIAGTRIRVQDIYVWHELQGLSADEITSRYPQINMAAVYTALAFYWEHRDQIQQQMAAETNFVEQMKQKNISPLRQKLNETDAAINPLPS